MGMEKLGAKVTLEDGYVLAEAPSGLKGAIVFPVVGVGATENVLMAAALADGVTTMTNVAREPEIVDLADCLNALGAKITRTGHRHNHRSWCQQSGSVPSQRDP